MSINHMNIIRIDKNNLVNGSGMRCVIWCSGCAHNCEGCHNPETHDHKAGHPFSENDFQDIVDQLKKPEVSGVTFSGGDPLYIFNYEHVKMLCKQLKEMFPNKTIWVYTGSTYENIEKKEILKYIDVLVDGRFELKLATAKYRYRGSLNQRVIDVQRSLLEKEIILWEDIDG